jgi:enamine deaminase RidA (YjgF/YER057c/UK114 family)
MPDFEARAKELGLDLSSPPSPVAVYRPAVRTGNLVFVSGNVNILPDGTLSATGKAGREVTLEQAKDAARIAGINCLKAARSVLGGDLNRVVKLVRTVGFVASEDGFNDQPAVINGASEVLRDVFGEEAGVGARLAVGLFELPLRAPVEVEIILEVRD